MTDAEQFTNQLIERLAENAKSFYRDSGAHFYEAKSTYNSKHQAADNIQSHHIDLYYNNYIIRFSYYPHIPFSTSHSALTSFVSFDKTDSQRLFYPLSQVYGFLGVTPANALTIPLILSPDSMTECFAYIADALTAIRTDIEDLSYNEEKKDALLHTELDYACAYLKSEFPTMDEIESVIDEHKDEWYNSWISDSYEQPLSPDDEIKAKEDFEQLILRINDEAENLLSADQQKILTLYFQLALAQSLGAGYEAYMVGNYPTAIKKLKKLKNKTPYESLLIDDMESAKTPRRHIPESIFKNLTELYKNGTSKNGLKEALAIAPAMFIFGAPWALLFIGVYFLFYYFESRGSIYLLGSLDNAPSVILPAMLMGIVMIYFQAKRFYKLFFRKNYQKLMELQNATFSHTTHKFMKGLTVVLLIGSIAFLFLTVHQNVKLTDDGFYDNTRIFSIHGTFYAYRDVDRLHYRSETPDGDGGTFPYPSYVIILKNGERIDIDQFDSCNEKFLSAFQEKGVTVEQK